MLTRNLLLVKRSGDKIVPRFIEASGKHRELAEVLIATYTNSLGQRKRDIQSTIRQMEEETAMDFRIVRGLSSILETRCEFVQVSNMDPVAVRKLVFKAAAHEGTPRDDESRTRVIASVAQEIHVLPEQIESALYADLEENLQLISFSSPSINDLVTNYNLSLTQTLLFQCSRLTLTTRNWKGLFRALRGLGLMYAITREAGVYSVTVEGPLSTVRQTARYGTRLARLVPSIVSSDNWSVDAQIVERRRPDRVLHLRITSEKHGHYFAIGVPAQEEDFDSNVERDFARRFRAITSGWKITREPGPLVAGTTVMIPDFVFRKSSTEVFLEIAGFWTPEYLARKLEKTRLLEEVDFILAVDEKNVCEEIAGLPEYVNVIMYRGKVPLSPILKHLRTREEYIRRAHREQLKKSEIDIGVPAISLEDLARKLDVEPIVLLEHLKEAGTGDYVLIVDVLVSKSTLDSISEALAKRIKEGPLTLSGATDLIEKLGGTSCTRILDHLGYHTDWSSLDVDKALVTKVTDIES